jgi:S1-C subfamily serine protease
MKLCQTCGQALAEQIETCPACGSEVVKGLEFVDDYQILEIVHEGHASILCRAIRQEDQIPVALRLFTANSGVDETVALRLKAELEELQKLPEEWFVQHHAIKCSSDGIWYRVSEWLDAESWGDLLSSGRLQDQEVAYDLFRRLAAILDGLHQSGHFIPHLILNDILVLKGEPGRVDVKIDYKLSRFLDPKMAQPGLMLNNLLVCHPDITGKRPLNFKTDVWSLGRVFVQILTADLEICDPRPAAKAEDFPKGFGVLVRSMLADDPDLRPHSMAEVADALIRIKQEALETEAANTIETVGEIRRLKKTFIFFGLIISILAAVGGVFMFQFFRKSPNGEVALGEYADRYAGSVAFVVVEYQVQVDDMVLYKQRIEGTAFLVDSDGYLLTNRHVACPWLEDENLFTVVEQIRNADKIPRFNYKMHLWFEGETAFNLLYGLGSGGELTDVYDLSSAYSRGGNPSLSIAGVARAPVRIGQMIRAPLRDDFAVLKIDKVPQKLVVLPLDRELDVTKLKRLSPVIALGFPLGSRTQADTINVSVTRGHVRRTFENFFQVDTSIYRGNSGGPIIDDRGKVIGIASAVATEAAMAPLPVITPLSDIGLVLPVTKAVDFISDLKSGQIKWNGVIDFSVETKIKKITETAIEGRWAAALELAVQNLEESNDSSLVMAAAIIYFCSGDFDGAGTLLDRALSIDPDNHQARLIRYLVDRRDDRGLQSPHLRELLRLDWRSSGEFLGYLGRILSGSVDIESALLGWENLNEKGWISYMAGVLAIEDSRIEEAWRLFSDAVLSVDTNEWVLYLALAELDRMSADRVDGANAMMTFREEFRQIIAAKAQELDTLSSLASDFERAAADPEKRQQLLAQIISITPDNRHLKAIMAFYGAIASDWPGALEYANDYLQFAGREDALRLGTSILVPGVLQQMGKKDEARLQLQEFCRLTDTSWYRQICETLLGERSEEDLIEKAGKVPENILTARTALGFQAEALGDRNLAIRHYREALGSYLVDWIEYDLARQRYIKLRQDQK